MAFLLACTAALDKWFVMSGGDVCFADRAARSFTLSIGKCGMLLLFFGILGVLRVRPTAKNRGVWMDSWEKAPKWVILSGVFEAIVLVLQLTAVQFTVAAIVISIKRSGILLACFLGWFVFGERDITDRVIGSFVMIAGVVVFFLTKPNAEGLAMVGLGGAIGVGLLALAGMSVALYLTRSKPAVPAPEPVTVR